FLDSRYQHVKQEQISLTQMGTPLIMLEDKTFWTTQNNCDFYRFFDNEPGTVEFAGRPWLISSVTRHVDEDGTSYFFLPTISKYLVKSPLDNAYQEVTVGGQTPSIPLTIDGIEQTTMPRLQGVDLLGRPVCYTNQKTFYHQQAPGKWVRTLDGQAF